ncbi:hypothetical protein [Streptomyces liangshanensis]|uniref:hypothetical protein n=1 Tax=Streptomyces liangshanensis TaxID=2717324 RepID=UPI0036D78192
MKPSLLVVGLSALVLVSVSACSGGKDSDAGTGTTATPSATATTPAPASTPTSPDGLPDPVQSPAPVGSKTLYTGSGQGAGAVTLPASAGKASSVTVMWTCAGPATFDITAAGKTLAGSECGDGSGVFTAKVPHAHLNDLAWKFTAPNSVIWRLVVSEPPAK